MDIVIVAGFLGSGKTSLLLTTISKVIERTGKRVVVIVNDFGTIGIDGKIMTKYGLQVRELASGCICCSLGVDLLESVEEVERAYHPDLIVIEPTGVADPEAIVEVLGQREEKDRVRTIVIVDAARFEAIMKVLKNPLEAQLRSADLILINKMDAVDKMRLKDIEKALREVNPAPPIILVSATEGTNIDQVVEAMVSR
jgi:G3E family GTPase